jgi:hypothetical protein
VYLLTNNLQSQEKKMYDTKVNMAMPSRGHYFQMLIVDVTMQMEKALMMLITQSVSINLKDQ